MNNEIIFDALEKILEHTEDGTNITFYGNLKRNNTRFILHGLIVDGFVIFYTYKDGAGSYFSAPPIVGTEVSFNDFIKFLKLLNKNNTTRTIKCPYVIDFYDDDMNIVKHNCEIKIGYRRNFTRLNIENRVINFRTKMV